MRTPATKLAEWEEVLSQHGAAALVQRHDLSTVQLSELMVYLASGGGVSWPTQLVRLGADPNYCDDEGGTTLSQCVHAASPHASAKETRVDTFRTAIELLSIGADPNQIYGSYCSVTSLALTADCPEFVALFLLTGADLIRVEPDDDRTLREVLLESEHTWAQQILKNFERSSI